MKLCSACLLGVNCRFDGNNQLNDKVLELSKKEVLIPVCPEQLGGEPTPRPGPKEIKNGRVVNKEGQDFTDECEKGAKEVLKIANTLGIKEMISRQRSPSCGCGKIYDGTFSGKIIEGDGLTIKLLKKNGIKVISEEDL